MPGVLMKYISTLWLWNGPPPAAPPGPRTTMGTACPQR
jgi:hypothetical protein